MTSEASARAQSRFASLAAAIVAVLAALGTLFTHHRSIQALAAKNTAILTQSRAADLYTSYESKQVRYNFYRVLLDSNVLVNAKVRARVTAASEQENASSQAVLQRAKTLEAQANGADERSDTILKSYETLQFATSAFEISIVLISISAFAGTRLFLSFGCGMSVLGLALFVAGLVQGR